MPRRVYPSRQEFMVDADQVTHRPTNDQRDVDRSPNLTAASRGEFKDAARSAPYRHVPRFWT
jgi:hypothetical protein